MSQTNKPIRIEAGFGVDDYAPGVANERPHLLSCLLEEVWLISASHSHRVSVLKNVTFHIIPILFIGYNLLIINNIYNIYSIEYELVGTLKNNCDSETET